MQPVVDPTDPLELDAFVRHLATEVREAQERDAKRTLPGAGSPGSRRGCTKSAPESAASRLDP